jgi:hypothetical protein
MHSARYFSHILIQTEFSWQIFMKIRPVGAELFHTDRRTEMTKLRGAEKSLARPGRKQATANKLRIYSTYAPRSLIHFLARCSKFASHSTKKINLMSVQPGLRGSNDLRVGRKMANFNC